MIHILGLVSATMSLASQFGIQETNSRCAIYMSTGTYTWDDDSGVIYGQSDL